MQPYIITPGQDATLYYNSNRLCYVALPTISILNKDVWKKLRIEKIEPNDKKTDLKYHIFSKV